MTNRFTRTLFTSAALLLVVLMSTYLVAQPRQTVFARMAAADIPIYVTPVNVKVLQQEPSVINDQEALARLYKHVIPSVVNIKVTVRTTDVGALGNDSAGALVHGEGSGFIYDNLGHIVTNHHVVAAAEAVVVVFHNGFWADAEVVASDTQSDLAVLNVQPPKGMEWRPLPLAEPETLEVGHAVVAIGNPFRLGGSMTTGIVSALGRGLPVAELGGTRYTLPDLIQTDAAINPGNSGGPLLNLTGQVVGVNFAIESPSHVNAGVGFAIPSVIVRRVVPALITHGKYDYAYLGLSGRTIDEVVAKALELPNNRLGVYIAEVVADGPADKAGLRGGSRSVDLEDGSRLGVGADIIIAINDTPVQQFEDLVSYLIVKAAPNQTVTLTILRDGKERKVEVVLGERPQPESTEPVNSPHRAIEIALEAVQGKLNDPVTQTTVVPEIRNEREVWVVTLTTARQTALVVIDRSSGEVLEVTIE